MLFSLVLSLYPNSLEDFTFFLKELTARPTVSRNCQGISPINQLKGALMVHCVHMGMGPGEIDRLFGSPSMYGISDSGPPGAKVIGTEEYWYPELGISILFPCIRRDCLLQVLPIFRILPIPKHYPAPLSGGII
jgi:hypothetical protein